MAFNGDPPRSQGDTCGLEADSSWHIDPEWPNTFAEQPFMSPLLELPRRSISEPPSQWLGQDVSQDQTFPPAPPIETTFLHRDGKAIAHGHPVSSRDSVSRTKRRAATNAASNARKKQRANWQGRLDHAAYSNGMLQSSTSNMPGYRFAPVYSDEPLQSQLRSFPSQTVIDPATSTSAIGISSVELKDLIKQAVREALAEEVVRPQ